MTLKILSEPILIEEKAGEDVADFTNFIENEIVARCFPNRPGWLEYSVDQQFRWNGRIFRGVSCAAGSFHGRIILAATSKQGLPRTLLTVYEKSGVCGMTLIENGIENPVTGDLMRLNH